MWVTDSGRDPVNNGMATVLSNVKKDYFTGRHRETERFQEVLQDSRNTKQILNIYGTSGIGKTSLLHAFQKVTEPMEDVVFFNLDSDDFIHSPSFLAEQMIALISTKLHIRPPHTAQSLGLEDCLHIIRNAAKVYQIVVAVDNYERIGELDRWFREVFINHLPTNVMIVLAGRHPLTEGWLGEKEAGLPITQLHVTGFNYDETCRYLKDTEGEVRQEVLKNFWGVTQGNPLLLSLARLAHNHIPAAYLYPENKIDRLAHLVKEWLDQFSHKEDLALIQAASILRQFDHTVLSYVLKSNVSHSAYSNLIALPFVKQSNHGWTVHEAVRNALSKEFRDRNPEQEHRLRKQSAFYYLHRMDMKELTDRNLQEYLHHIRVEVNHSELFAASSAVKKEVRSFDFDHFDELERLFYQLHPSGSDSAGKLKEEMKALKLACPDQNRKWLSTGSVKDNGYQTCQLVKNEAGEILGLSTTLPICKETIKQLKIHPTASSFFNGLSMMEEKEFTGTHDAYPGWYIRMTACENPEDTETGLLLLYHLFPLLLTGGKMIISTPAPSFQELLKFFGFREAEESQVEQNPYGNTSSTYMLDVRGRRFIHYLNNLTQTVFSASYIPD